jgi:hypothetical protein
MTPANPALMNQPLIARGPESAPACWMQLPGALDSKQPVASSAVIFRSRRITTGGSAHKTPSTAQILSVAQQKRSRMRKMVA